MADIVKNPPKDEITPGQAIESRKTGDKKVVEELQDFNAKTAELAKDVKTGFRAIVEGIKEGNEELNPKEREKTLVSGFGELSDAQQNIVDIFGDMKASAAQSQTAIAKDMAVERIVGLETGREQFSLWERMLLRLVGIDEDMDKLIANTMPGNVKGEGRGWLGKFILGAISGGIIGLIAGIIVGFGQALIFYLKMVGRMIRFIGAKFINAKMFRPIVDPIKNFFNNIGARVAAITKTGGGWFAKNVTNPFRNIRTNFLWGLFGKGGGVQGLKTTRGVVGGQFGSTSNIFVRIGDTFRRIGALMTRLWAPFKAFNAKTKGLWTSIKGTGIVATEGTGLFARLVGRLKTFWGIIKFWIAPFMVGFKEFAIIGFKLGVVIGRLSLWGTVIIGVIEGIMGGFKKAKSLEGPWWKKMLAGIFGFLQGAINGIFMIPIDLILFGLAWLIGLFGKPGQAIKKAMNKFSLEDIWMGLTDMLFDAQMALIDWLRLLFSDPGAAVAQAVTGFNNMIDNFMKWILGMILPDPRGLAWYNPKSLIAAAIPDSVYEFAGLDPATGNPPPDLGEMGPPVPEESRFAKGLDKTADWFSGLFKEDPALSLHGGGDLAFVGPPTPGGVFIDQGGNITKEGDTTINVVGGDSSGEETRWRLFSRFRD